METLLSEFDSEDGEVPEINFKEMDLISSLITTFEAKDLKSKNTMNMYYDPDRDYIFMDLVADVNGERIADYLAGWDKDKIVNFCKNIIKYFDRGELENFRNFIRENTEKSNEK